MRVTWGNDRMMMKKNPDLNTREVKGVFLFYNGVISELVGEGGLVGKSF